MAKIERIICYLEYSEYVLRGISSLKSDYLQIPITHYCAERIMLN